MGRGRLNAWPAITDLFAALMIASLGALVLQRDGGCPGCRERLAQAEQEAEAAKQQAAEERVERARIAEVLGVISTVTRFPKVIATVDEARTALENYKGGGRGPCQEPNLLADVTVDSGAESVKVLNVVARYPLSFSPGQILDTAESIAEFLAEVTQAYRQFRADSMKDCRFSYRLLWRTDRDYRVGKEKFEQVFNPERSVPLAVQSAEPALARRP